jgi:hypothetical protein
MHRIARNSLFCTLLVFIACERDDPPDLELDQPAQNRDAGAADADESTSVLVDDAMAPEPRDVESDVTPSQPPPLVYEDCRLVLEDVAILRGLILTQSDQFIVPELSGNSMLEFLCPAPSDRRDATVIVQKQDGDLAYAPDIDLSPLGLYVTDAMLREGIPVGLSTSALLFMKDHFGEAAVEAAPGYPSQPKPIPVKFHARQINWAMLEIRHRGAGRIIRAELDPDATVRLKPGTYLVSAQVAIRGDVVEIGSLEIPLGAEQCDVKMLAGSPPRMDRACPLKTARE